MKEKITNKDIIQAVLTMTCLIFTGIELLILGRAIIFLHLDYMFGVLVCGIIIIPILIFDFKVHNIVKRFF